MSNKKSLNENIKSILVILFYFFMPYLVNFITDSSLVKAVIYGIYFLIIIFLYKDTFKKDFKAIKADKKNSIKTIIIGILSIFIVMMIVNLAIGIIFDLKESSGNEYSLINIFEKSPIILMILTCVYYPVVEGIVFRKAVRDIIDKKWVFIIFSSLFYFFFNIVYTSISFNAVMSSLCYFAAMMVLSYIYYKKDNFSISMIILMGYNLIFSLLNFLIK